MTRGINSIIHSKANLPPGLLALRKEERSLPQDVGWGQSVGKTEGASEYECFCVQGQSEDSEVKVEKPAVGPCGVYVLSFGCETGGTTC